LCRLTFDMRGSWRAQPGSCPLDEAVRALGELALALHPRIRACSNLGHAQLLAVLVFVFQLRHLGLSRLRLKHSTTWYSTVRNTASLSLSSAIATFERGTCLRRASAWPNAAALVARAQLAPEPTCDPALRNSAGPATVLGRGPQVPLLCRRGSW
jgi:hypothetical protein